MQAVYYRSSKGFEPVSAFIDQVPPQVRASLDLQMDRLNMLMPSDPPRRLLIAVRFGESYEKSTVTAANGSIESSFDDQGTSWCCYTSSRRTARSSLKYTSISRRNVGMTSSLE